MEIAPDNTADIAVKYIYRRPHWKDTIYGTGLEFVTGQTRVLPRATALKFLKHVDTFQVDKSVKVAQPPKDTTETTLAKAEKKRTEEEAIETERFEMYDALDQMSTKDAVVQFAHDKFKVDLDKKDTLAELRQQTKGLVDRFGTT